MSYPVGVLTRQLVVRGSVELETGEGVVQVAKLVASRNLIWMSTNERLFTLGGEVLRGGASEPLIFQPPVTDQQGYRDKATGAIIDVSEENSHTHTYIVLMWCERDGKRVGSTWATTKPFALPTGDLSPVDVDTLVEVGIVDGVAVLVPDTWSARLDALEAGGVGSATRGLIITAVDVATIPAGDTLDNLAAYYAKYHNFQANNPDTVAGVLVTRFTNAGTISTRGGELDFLFRPAPDLNISGGVAYTDAKGAADRARLEAESAADEA